jgi:CHAD domain-containing protein
LLPDPKTTRPPESLESRLKSLGRELSPTRDRDVATATLLALAAKRGDARQQAAARRWTAGVATGAASTATGVPDIAGALVRLRPALARHLAKAARPEALAGGLAHALRKTRRWQRRAVDSREPEAFHAWRRWQKRLETQLRWISADHGKGTKAVLADLHAQQEALGRLHDLDVLADLLRATPGAGAQGLLPLVAERQRRLAARLCDRARRPLRRLARAVRDARRDCRA